MKTLMPGLLLSSALVGAIAWVSAVAAENKTAQDEYAFGTTALLLVVNGKAVTTIRYVSSYHCESALQKIEEKARTARPKLEVFGVCTSGGPAEPKR